MARAYAEVAREAMRGDSPDTDSDRLTEGEADNKGGDVRDEMLR